jgi:hypothetical protein
MPGSRPSWKRMGTTRGVSFAGLAAVAVVIALTAGVPLPAAADSFSIRDYFPLQADTLWTLQDVDNDPGDDEGFSWIVRGTGPQTVGTQSAWKIETDAQTNADSREGDCQFWDFYNGQADLGLYGVYEKAGASPLAADQTIAFSAPLRFGTERMAVGWSAAAAATATFRVTLPFVGTVSAPGTVASTVTLADHLDELSTPLGLFYDVVVLTVDVSGSASYLGFPVFQGTLLHGTFFLARAVGLVRSTRNLDPASTQAQAISGGRIGGMAIVPPPPPAAQGLSISASHTETGENGDSATVSVVLDAPPTAPVTVILTCDDASEASFTDGAPAVAVVFSRTDWNEPRQVRIAGADDAEWDGDQVYHVTFALNTADPDYAALDPSQWTLTMTNRDDEALDIGDYFVLLPGSHWHYEVFNEDTGTVTPSGSAYSWSVEEAQPILHGVPVTAIRTDADDPTNPLNGTANLWSLDPDGNLLLHGIRLPVGFERDVDYLGNTYHAVVPPQTMVFAAPLVAGTRDMVTHAPVSSATTADVQVTGLPLISVLPVTVASRGELLGLRERKRTPLGVFTHVPILLLTVSIDALGETVQDQGGTLFLARNIGVVCQTAAEQPESPNGMALAAGTVGAAPIVADESGAPVLHFTLTLQRGWNLVALPFRPIDPSPTGVFGTAILGHAWRPCDGTQVAVTALQAGRAYWVYRNPAAAADDAPLDVRVNGTPEPAATRTVKAGWLFAGVISDSPDVSLTLPIPSGADPLCRVAWTWGPGGFQPVRDLPVGAGACLYIDSPGVINLAPTATAGGVSAVGAPAR